MRARPRTEAVRITPAEARTILAGLQRLDPLELDTGLDAERLDRLAVTIGGALPR